MKIAKSIKQNSGAKGMLLFCLLLVHAKVLAADKAVVFCHVDWPPYTETINGEAQGITISIIREAAKLLGREISFVKREWNECLEQVKQGGFDAILDAAKRETYLQGPASFNSYIDAFWVRNESGINSYDQLAGAKIALVKGYAYDDRLMAQLEDLGVEVIRGIDDPTIVRELAMGKVDAAVGDLASTFHFASGENLQIHPILPPFTEDQLYTSFYAGRPRVQREFDRAFARLLEQGFVDEVYQKYIGVTYSSFSSRN